MRTEQQILGHFTSWAESNLLIRAAVLTSSRVNPSACTDFLSDYDIELYVSDLTTFIESDEWLSEFGTIMVRWPFKPRSTGKDGWITRLILFSDGVRIDFQITAEQHIKPEAYANGYKVLIDKDALTTGLAKPTYNEFVINRPSKEEYEAVVNEFWWDIYYVPKYLWRDELPFAKYMSDNIVRFSFLHKVINWYIGMNHDWSVETGALGKKYKHYLSPELWHEYTQTFAAAELEDNWEAMFNTIALFRKLAKQVGSHLGYDYPDKVDQEVTEFCTKIKNTP